MLNKTFCMGNLTAESQADVKNKYFLLKKPLNIWKIKNKM